MPLPVAVQRLQPPRLQGAQAIGPRRERIAQRLHEEWIDRARHLAAQTHGPVRGRAMHAREAMASERQPLGCGRNGGGELHDRVAHEEARQHHGDLRTAQRLDARERLEGGAPALGRRFAGRHGDGFFAARASEHQAIGVEADGYALTPQR